MALRTAAALLGCRPLRVLLLSLAGDRPAFDVSLTWRDLAIVVAVCGVYVAGVLPVFLKLKGYL